MIVIYSFIIIMILTILLIFGIISYYSKKDYENSEYRKATGKTYNEVLHNKGTRGEYHLYNSLRPFLNTGAKILTNLYLPYKNETSEVDIVLIHRSGIFVFECKNYKGWIFGSQDNYKWTQTFKSGKKYTFYNPIMQNDKHIKCIKNSLQCKYIPIYSIIVFSDECTLKKLNVTRSDVVVTKGLQVCNSIQKFMNDNVLDDYDIKIAYERLAKYCNASDDVKIRHINTINRKYK